MVPCAVKRLSVGSRQPVTAPRGQVPAGVALGGLWGCRVHIQMSCRCTSALKHWAVRTRHSYGHASPPFLSPTHVDSPMHSSANQSPVSELLMCKCVSSEPHVGAVGMTPHPPPQYL